jgi:hypothetical protein
VSYVDGIILGSMFPIVFFPSERSSAGPSSVSGTRCVERSLSIDKEATCRVVG